MLQSYIDLGIVSLSLVPSRTRGFAPIGSEWTMLVGIDGSCATTKHYDRTTTCGACPYTLSTLAKRSHRPARIYRMSTLAQSTIIY
mmetsp:Transcript_16092/g.29104  ORF Transcript_16092/g.29104 Transcript_16092/m.29104 type:complete len:86 (-) Transcript_16092:1365-1622(-)